MRESIQIPIKKLKLLDNNPRKITKEQFQKLCDSIKKDPDFFLNRPCLVNEKDGIYHVYAGNQRVKAARQLGWKSVPCIVEQDLPDDRIKERVAKDNAHFGDWDWDVLANEWDIDLLLESGFTEDQLVGSFGDVDVVENEEGKEEKEEPVKTCPHCNGIL